MTSQPINKYFIYCNFIDDCSIKQLWLNMILLIVLVVIVSNGRAK